MGTIVDINAKDIMFKNALEYSEESCLRNFTSLADNLKAAQRGVMLATHDLTYKSDSFTKSANVMGAVLGDYYPHNDASVYNTALFMASQKAPLIEVQGATQSKAARLIAAQRYTNLKLSKLGREMFSTMDFVDKIPNYDDKKYIPRVLMPRFPYALMADNVNIGYGIASTILPFNPTEVLDAMKLLVHKPDASTDELAEIIQGPDLDKGHKLYMTKESLRSLIENGDGLVVSICDVDIVGDEVIIKEVPWREKGSELYESIVKKVGNFKKIGDLSSRRVIGSVKMGTISNSSNRDIYIAMKADTANGYTAEDVAEELYNKTNLKKTYNIELIYLNDENKLIKLGIRDILNYYIEVNRKYLIHKYTKQLEDLDARNAENLILERITREEERPWFKEAIFMKNKKQIVMEHGYTKEEADIIFGGGNLNKLSERDSILAEIASYQEKREAILEKFSDSSIREETSAYIDYIKELVYKGRDSEVYYTLPKSKVRSITPARKDVEVSVYITDKNFIAAVPEGSTVNMVHGMNIAKRIQTRTSSYVVAVTQYSLVKISVSDITSSFKPISLYTDCTEAIKGVFELKEDCYYTFVSNKGGIKKISASELNSTHTRVTGFKFEQDEFIVKYLTHENENVCIDTITSMGYMKRLYMPSFAERARISGFSKSTKLDVGDSVVDAKIAEADESKVYLMTSKGATLIIINPDSVLNRSPYIKGYALKVDDVLGFISVEGTELSDTSYSTIVNGETIIANVDGNISNGEVYTKFEFTPVLIGIN